MGFGRFFMDSSDHHLQARRKIVNAQVQLMKNLWMERIKVVLIATVENLMQGTPTREIVLLQMTSSHMLAVFKKIQDARSSRSKVGEANMWCWEEFSLMGRGTRRKRQRMYKWNGYV